MNLNKKNKMYRLICFFSLIVVLVVSCLFLWRSFKNNVEYSYILEIITIIVLIVFIVLEAVVIIKNYKKPLVIQDLVYEKNNKLNMMALIIVIVGLIIGLLLLIFGLIWFFAYKGAEIYSYSHLFIPVALFLTVNCVLYFLYAFLYRPRKFTVDDLAKVHELNNPSDDDNKDL